MPGGVKVKPTAASQTLFPFSRFCGCQAGGVNARSSSWTNTVMLGIQFPGVPDPRKGALLQLSPYLAAWYH